MTHTRHIGWRPAREHSAWRRALATTCMFLALAVSNAAQADVVGPACVENGGLISIDGKRSEGRCIDGTPVRLYGVLAPALAQRCLAGEGQTWRCGLAAAAALLQAVKGRQVECRGNSYDAKGQLIAICFINGRSVNQFMIEMGWAEADRSITSMFNDIEAQARAAKRGLWSSDYLASGE